MVYQVLNFIHFVGLYSQLFREPQETILGWPYISPSKVHVFNLLILVYHTQHTQKGRRKKNKTKRDKPFVNSTQVKRAIQRNEMKLNSPRAFWLRFFSPRKTNSLVEFWCGDYWVHNQCIGYNLEFITRIGNSLHESLFPLWYNIRRFPTCWYSRNSLRYGTYCKYEYGIYKWLWG